MYIQVGDRRQIIVLTKAQPPILLEGGTSSNIYLNCYLSLFV